jgi:hypothetical protein
LGIVELGFASYTRDWRLDRFGSIWIKLDTMGWKMGMIYDMHGYGYLYLFLLALALVMVCWLGV